MSAFAALRDVLAGRPRHVRPATRRAAVLVPIIDDADPARLLLTVRTRHLSTHAGQVAFPGGGLDADDDGPVDAALREAREEIGLPGDRVEILGLLDDFPTVSGKMIVTPVVGRITDLPALTAEPGEVARIFTVPLDALRVRDGWTIRYHEADGQRWPIHFFPWEGELLWGLSAYVTLQLLSLLPEGGPIDLPPPYGQGPLPDANAKPWKA